MPTNTTMFAIRIGVVPQDDEDLKKVNALQEQFKTTSLSSWGDPSKFGQVTIPPLAKRPDYQGDLAYFQTVADLLAENPPPKDREAAVILLSRGDIDVGQPMDPAKLDEPARKGLARAEAMGPQIMKWKVKFRGTPYPTRWNNLRPGTYGFDYFDRAAGALEGLFVHDREEAEYFSTYEDRDAHLLDGANRYVVHFNKDELPPTLEHGFWSFTMYGADFQLVKNPINRFSIGDRTKGLTANPDGSLDVYIQNQPPAGHESNWLPSPPSGLFRINYRIYLPAKEAQDPATLGKYLPPIKKAGCFRGLSRRKQRTAVHRTIARVPGRVAGLCWYPFVAISNVPFTSTPAVGSAQIADIPRGPGNRVKTTPSFSLWTAAASPRPIALKSKGDVSCWHLWYSTCRLRTALCVAAGHAQEREQSRRSLLAQVGG